MIDRYTITSLGADQPNYPTMCESCRHAHVYDAGTEAAWSDCRHPITIRVYSAIHGVAYDEALKRGEDGMINMLPSLAYMRETSSRTEERVDNCNFWEPHDA